MKTRLIGNDAADFAETVRGFLDYFYKDEMVISDLPEPE
jgi:hypothetical protein